MRYGWRLNGACWRQLGDQVAGCHWKRTYLEENYANQVPVTPGVYLICAGAKDVPLEGRVMERLYNAIYAGQATNLRRRFRQHVSGYGAVQDAKSTFRRLDFWYTPAHVADLDDMEQMLIDAFGPPANGKNVKARIGEPVPAGRTIGEAR